uniref:c-SKI SMAD4-binding domain-containing protein n=2 Tax=Stomoxys calcitrans TaxID=35570 RepID=A0A1I8Q3R1_STOCA
TQVRTVLLYGIPIVSLYIDGLERLCLAQISNILLKKFSYNEIHNRRVALGITCVQCTPVQLEILRRAGAMPISSRRCGMITRREAERLCKSFIGDNSPPRLPKDFAFNVHHNCAWGCRGWFIPTRYNSSRAKCIKCQYCNIFFSPNKFIFHSHQTESSGKYIQPIAANFNSWRRHLMLTGKPTVELAYIWEDVKAMFNGGTRKRYSPTTSSPMANSGLCSENKKQNIDIENDKRTVEKQYNCSNLSPAPIPGELISVSEINARSTNFVNDFSSVSDCIPSVHPNTTVNTASDEKMLKWIYGDSNMNTKIVPVDYMLMMNYMCHYGSNNSHVINYSRQTKINEPIRQYVVHKNYFEEAPSINGDGKKIVSSSFSKMFSAFKPIIKPKNSIESVDSSAVKRPMSFPLFCLNVSAPQVISYDQHDKNASLTDSEMCEPSMCENSSSQSYDDIANIAKDDVVIDIENSEDDMTSMCKLNNKYTNNTLKTYIPDNADVNINDVYIDVVAYNNEEDRV